MEKLYLKDVSKELNVPEYVLRFYDKKGLFPFLERDINNYRYISKDKLEWLKVVVCLKKSGMPLKEIKKYVELAVEGDSTIISRFEMMKKQEIATIKKIECLKEQLEFIQYKKSLYEKKIK
ncbi:MerR family transcriptional regulator [Spiroplasma litorale]|uniref:MerR family transcriptional regulator n=1 Tax=Spiroplasma litorale TaxID=216942 RepID=A0A0K1W2S7_9MOLU|nr:MerR family transcriptional regulator [Spiroplasma litorale]AKX34630.1 MerR family transcriptional regulator [Spiroplasma litorale]